MERMLMCFACMLALAGDLLFAQAQHHAYCWSANGLGIYEQPTNASAVVGKIACREKVAILDTLTEAPYTDTLNESIPVQGHWMNIRHGDLAGYAFSGYLSLTEPQTLQQYFEGISPVKEILTDGAGRYTYTRKDQSQYSYEVHDGCWAHEYFLKGATLNDGLMFISATEPHEPEGCPLVYIKVEGNKYFLADCDASQERMLEVIKDGIVYQSYDCD